MDKNAWGAIFPLDRQIKALAPSWACPGLVLCDVLPPGIALYRTSPAGLIATVVPLICARTGCAADHVTASNRDRVERLVNNEWPVAAQVLSAKVL